MPLPDDLFGAPTASASALPDDLFGAPAKPEAPQKWQDRLEPFPLPNGSQTVKPPDGAGHPQEANDPRFKGQGLVLADGVGAGAGACGSANLLVFDEAGVRVDSTDQR